MKNIASGQIELKTFHTSSVKACLKRILGIDARPITDGTVIYFAPDAGQKGEANAKHFVSHVQTEFSVGLEKSERLGSIAQKEEWAKTGDDYQTFVMIRR